MILGLVKLETCSMVTELQGYIFLHLQSPSLSVKTKSKYCIHLTQRSADGLHILVPLEKPVVENNIFLHVFTMK